MTHQFIMNTKLRAGLAAAVLLMPSALRVCGEEIPVGEGKLTYEEAGSGPVVLFLHGAVSDHRVWGGIRDRVAERHRFVAYDQRYFGPAEWPDEAAGFSVATHAEDLATVVDALDAGPVHLVTWSYGGLVGLRSAMDHPEKFRSIVHFEPTVSSLHAGLSGERAAISQKFAAFGPMAEALQAGEEKDAVRRLIEAAFRLEPGEADSHSDLAQQMWDDNARTLPPFLEAVAEAASIDCDALSRIEIPTLVIQGSDAYVLDAMMADEVVRCQPNAIGSVLEGTNHGGPVQDRAAFVDAVLSFVDATDAP
ncbi:MULTISPECIES: alpha/beta fold hydrolase [Roseobacteraceae]|uniref:alpha/beta fold hydrolase n=1 Tax=Roseobacteraceae TaxID=2854170 RepID=UPI0031D2401A